MELKDWNLSELGVDIWNRKYRRNNESFDEWVDRVSGGNQEVAQLIRDKKFLFGGRILSNRGLVDTTKLTYSNCYVLEPVGDSIEDIWGTASKLARTFSYGGGVGIDISNLREKDAPVNNAAMTTSGAVSFMPVFEMTSGIIGQNGRRGALMISMNCEHPDIHDFIDAKLDNKLEKCNISVKMSDIDMQTRDDVIMHIAHNNWDWAEPGILYWDTIEQYNLLDKYSDFKYAGVNPCLVGDTLIQTIDGPVAIKDLIGRQPFIYCMDDNGKLVIRQASKVWKTRENAQLVEIDFNRGKLICTPDHKIYTRNRGWVSAKDLQPKDKLNGLGFSKGNEINEMVKLTTDPKYYKHHRFIMEQMGYDIKDRDVHHIDGNHLNNIYSNLQVLPHGEHSTISNIGHEPSCPQDPTTGQFINKELKTERKHNGAVNVENKGKNFIVKKVTMLDYTEDVYDLTVPEVHNFIANNIVVHNCAEEPLPAGGSCLLGALNLSAFVENPFTEHPAFNIPDFKQAVKIAVTALNEVLDEGLPLHPLQEQRDTVRDWRQIGLGIMGFGDMLLMMGYNYDSVDALKLIDKIGVTLVNTGLYTSAMLAKEKGAFPRYDDTMILPSTFLQYHLTQSNITQQTLEAIQQYGLRNSQLFTIAPTGSISTMLGITGGVEPIFATHYTRKTQSLHGEDVTYNVYTPIVQYMLDNEIIDEVQVGYISTAQNMNPFDRVTVQAKWQQYIDASISSTVNLVEETDEETIAELYIKAWQMGCKGLTVYRAGCKKEGILVVDNKEVPRETEEPVHITLDEDTSIDNCVAHGTKVNTGCGSLWITVYFHTQTGKLCHIFLDKGSKGGCQSFMIGLSRMISLAGKKGATVDEIVDQLLSVPACPSYVTRSKTKGDTSPGTCCPSAIAHALQNLNNKFVIDQVFTLHPIETPKEEEPQPNKNVCPECGGEVQFSGGCNICPHCGYSKCD